MAGVVFRLVLLCTMVAACLGRQAGCIIAFAVECAPDWSSYLSCPACAAPPPLPQKYLQHVVTMLQSAMALSVQQQQSGDEDLADYNNSLRHGGAMQGCPAAVELALRLFRQRHFGALCWRHVELWRAPYVARRQLR
jgi:hypothetical protein